VRSRGSARDSSSAVASPDSRNSCRTASSSWVNQVAGSLVIFGWSVTVAKPLTNVRRSRAATASLHECWTTADAEPVGTTNIVRRIPSMRMRVRSV